MKLLERYLSGVCFIVFAVCFISSIAGAEIQTEAMPLAVIPEPTYESPTVAEGQDVIHDFIIQNQGAAILKVERVKTG